MPRRYTDDLFAGLEGASDPQPTRRRTYSDDLFAGLSENDEAAQTGDDAPGPSWIGTGLRVVPGVIGGIANTVTGGGAGLGAAIGATAGAVGEGLGQTYERLTGERDAYNPTQIALQAGLGAIPGVGLGSSLKGIGGVLARGAVNTGYGAVVGGLSNPIVERVEQQGVSGLDPIAALEDPELMSRLERGAKMGAMFGAGASVLGEGISHIAQRRAAARAADIDQNFDPNFDARQEPAPAPTPPEPPQAPPPVTSPVTPEPAGVLPPALPPPPVGEMPAPIPRPFEPPAPMPASAPPEPIIGRTERTYGIDDEPLPSSGQPPAPDPIEALLAEADRLDAQADQPTTRAAIEEAVARQAAPESMEDEVSRLMRDLGMDERAIAGVEEPELAGVGVNASGESEASAEAISRLAGMTDRGERFAVRTRGGYRDLLGPEAVDYRVKPGEEYGIIDADGNFRSLDRGEGAPTSPAPRAEGRRQKAQPARIEAAPDDLVAGEVYRMPPQDLEVRPKELQYKGGADEEGVTDAGRIQGDWDENAAGVLLAWRDPETGRPVALNGHHRRSKAIKAGVPDVLVRVVDAPDAKTARAIGALTNIKEEKGTPVDVAKLVRDSGFTNEDFRAAGIPSNSKLARTGLALAKLQDGIFGRVAQGEISPEVGAAIAGGDRPLSPEQQNAVLAIYERNRTRPQPRELTPAQIANVAEEVRASADIEAAAGAQSSLFGDESFQNTAVEKADLRDWLRKQISGERRDFGAVAKKGRAERIAEAGNQIAVDENARRAELAANEVKALDAIGAGRGPLNDALEDAAARILKGEKPDAVRKDLLTAARSAIATELGRPAARPAEPGIPFEGDRSGARGEPTVDAGGRSPAPGAENRAESGAPGSARNLPEGEPASRVPADPLADLLDTGEAQTRLPGDVGEVRNQERPTPQEDVPFSLTPEIGKRSELQDDLFGPGERGAVNIRAVAPIGGAVVGGTAGAATADEDASWQERAGRAALGALAGAAAGYGATRGAQALARGGRGVATDTPAQGRPAEGEPAAANRSRPTRRGPERLDIDRFEKYADEAGTEDAMRRAANQISPEEVAAWKGVSTDEMMRQAAAELDLTGEEMRRLQGDVANIRERVMAMRAINKGAFLRAREASEAVRANPQSAEALARFNASLDGWLGVQRSFTGARAEAGRFLRDFRQMAIEGMTPEQLSEFADIDARQQGRLVAIANGLQAIDPNDLRRANRFVTEAKRMTTGEKIYRFWLNLMLSGPQTHIANVVSTGLSSLTLPADRTAAGLLDLVRAKGSGTAQERFAREGAYAMVGMANGVLPGLRAGLKMMLTGESSFANTASRAGDLGAAGTVSAQGASKASRLSPIRALQAQDEVWKTVVESGDLYARASRQALREGKRGIRDVGARVAEILDNPGALKQEAQKEALYRTFNQPAGELGKLAIQARKKIPGAKVVFPFLLTPINIAKFGVQHTPAYAGKIMYDLAKGKYKGQPGALQDELAKVVTGSLLATGVAALWQRGWLTGGGRPERAAHATDVAKRPDYSVRVGDQWFSYNRLEPLGMSMGLIADYMELQEQDDNQVGKIVYSISRNLGSKTFLQAASDLMEAATDPNGYKRDRFLSNLAGSVVPTVIAQAAKMVDPIARRTKGPLERIQARIPGQSQDMRPVTNIFGEPVSEDYVGPVERFLSPVKRRPVNNDPLLDELIRLGIDLDVPSDKLTAKTPLSDRDKSALVQAKGQNTRKELERLMARPSYQQATDDKKEEMALKAINNARDEVSARARWRKHKAGRELTLEDLLGMH